MSGMLSTLRVYLEVITGVLLVATVGIISALIAAGIIGDRPIVIGISCAMMVLTAGIVGARLWRLMRPLLTAEEDTGSE